MICAQKRARSNTERDQLMATIVHDCPHCLATRAAFDVAFAQPHPTQGGLWNLLAICPACGLAIYAKVRSPSPHHNPKAYVGNLMLAQGYFVAAVFPEAEQSPAPEHVPEAAGRAYEQGARCLGRSDFTPAAAMFRRCLEIALKKFSPDIEAWKLEKRIDRLADAGKITQDLKTWAHRVRLDGNDALHEEEEFTRESATELMEFTRLLLTYLYTLPEKIRLRLGQADANSADTSSST